jgi:hypothetical protein
MKLLTRAHIALVLTVAYMAIVVSPLATLTIGSRLFAHAVAECSGECSICGCSPERSAAKLCCCWKKKLIDEQEHREGKASHCCKKKDADTCSTKKEGAAAPVISCGFPCGNQNQLVWNGDGLDLLPYRFVQQSIAFHEDTPSPFRRKSPPDCYETPPDPPPRLVVFC